jgi:predicted MFS family arabinose efflux permease
MSRMNSLEKRSALAIAFMIALRMYGLFLILPVFSIMGREISGATPVLLGVAVGVYGLTQAFLQIPMGFLSDVWGRKKVMALGLLLFLTGSVVAAMASSIEFIILGRLIQGMGAIASTGLALIADVSRPEQRGKMMGIVGSSIGLSFMLAFITGPLLAEWFGLAGLFWVTAILAGLALLVLWLWVQEPEKRIKRDYQLSELLYCIRQKQLVFMDLGIFVLHASMTALFLVLPLMLKEQFALAVSEHWMIYLPVLLASLLIMVPMIIMQEKHKKHQLYMLISFLLLGVNFVFFTLSINTIWLLGLLLVVYFGLFNFLEAAMPALLSKTADEHYRGAAMGVFSSAEFLGAFVGGVAGGWLMSRSMDDVFYALAGLLVLMSALGAWLLRR